MESLMAKAICADYNPVALLWADEQPAGAMQFRENKWGCVMWLAAHAARGGTAVAGVKTFGCIGGGVGLGFGDQYKNFPGGERGFCNFLSTGNRETEEGRTLAEKIRPFMREEAHDNFLRGERYIKTPALVGKFLEKLPVMQIPASYVVFKPLKDVNAKQEQPQSIIFFVNPDQLAALVVLANYGRAGNENVIIPYAAGCQTIGIYPYREAKTAQPRAVVGLTDLSARVYIRKQLANGNLLTFAVPPALFAEMEQNVQGSFLERPTWRELVARKE